MRDHSQGVRREEHTMRREKIRGSRTRVRLGEESNDPFRQEKKEEEGE